MQLDGMHVLMHNGVPVKILHKCLFFFFFQLEALTSRVCFSERILLALDSSVPFRNRSGSGRPEMSICLNLC